MKHFLAWALGVVVEWAAVQGHFAGAARMYGALQGLLERMGGVLWPADRARIEAVAAAARGALGPDAFDDAGAAGGALADAEAVERARSLLAGGIPPL